jgi:uncharacterized membrane protein YdbT with pleckstrin-like domain
MNEEQIIWKGTPSQVLNLPAFLLGSLAASVITVAALLTAVVTGPLALIVIAIAWVACLFPWLCKVISTKSNNYVVTNERLKLSTGVFNRKTEVMELYRVKDMQLEMPFHFRLFGLSRLILSTSDRSNPVLVLNAIRDGVSVSDNIRRHVEELRDKKRVREVDFEDDDVAQD